MIDTINLIKSTLNYKLSLSNIELYHSNLLGDVLERYPEIPFTLLDGIVKGYENYRIVNVWREKKHKDITLQMSDGKNDIQVVIENKFKSLPYREQLEKYMDGGTSNTFYILLSLTKPESDVLPEGWTWKSYDNLCDYYEIVSNQTSNSLYVEFLKDYNVYVRAISELLESESVDMKLYEYFLRPEVESALEQIGLIDLIHKIRYEKMCNLIRSTKVIKYSGRVRGAFYFGCCYKLSDEISFDIQIEGEQYRHKLNVSKSANFSLEQIKLVCSRLKEKVDMFTYKNNNIFSTAQRRVDWNKYETRDSLDLYNYVKIDRPVTFSDLINYLNDDLKRLIAGKYKIKETILESMNVSI
ncbi:TPA: PD-(D/E)XK nuclease family protein [Streptococcus suis]|nr:PD-(D/E)XK nuclease family protein [Streptococcus suis]